MIFQYFPGPGIFEEKNKDFPGLSRRRGNPDDIRMTSDNSGIGTFRSRLKTDLLAKAYAV